jgi:hypothetical protein
VVEKRPRLGRKVANLLENQMMKILKPGLDVPR